jgi:hypothetical protein
MSWFGTRVENPATTSAIQAGKVRRKCRAFSLGKGEKPVILSPLWHAFCNSYTRKAKRGAARQSARQYEI